MDNSSAAIEQAGRLWAAMVNRFPDLVYEQSAVGRLSIRDSGTPSELDPVTESAAQAFMP